MLIRYVMDPKTPKNTLVYVDKRRAGVIEPFDGGWRFRGASGRAGEVMASERQVKRSLDAQP